jgi:hypothetical protein
MCSARAACSLPSVGSDKSRQRDRRHRKQKHTLPAVGSDADVESSMRERQRELGHDVGFGGSRAGGMLAVVIGVVAIAAFAVIFIFFIR